MSLFQNEFAKGNRAIPYPPQAGVVVAHRFFVDIGAAPAVNDIYEAAPILANCRVVDIVVDSADMDTGTTLAFDVGIMSGGFGINDAARTCGNEFFAATPVAQTGGVARATKQSALNQASSGSDRSIGLKCTAAATGFTAGQIALTVYTIAA